MVRASHSPVPMLLAAVLAVFTSARLAGHQGQPTFRTGVDLVTLDVIPRDAQGQFVADLQKDDFEVFEQGVRQEIATLVLVHGGRVFASQTVPTPTANIPEGIVLPSAAPRDPSAGRIFVLLIDDLHFTATDTPLVRALLKKVAATLLHDGDMFAVFSTGPSSI